MQTTDLSAKPWWAYIEEDLRELLKESILLIDIFEKQYKQEFHDYAFIVFPAAKAYEGFLKKVFLDMGFITDVDYRGKRFRIGKALNPALSKKYPKRNVYKKLLDFCNSETLPDKLWQTWKKCRNLVFHWFPEEQNAIGFAVAKKRVEMIITAMDETFTTCKIS